MNAPPLTYNYALSSNLCRHRSQQLCMKMKTRENISRSIASILKIIVAINSLSEVKQKHN